MIAPDFIERDVDTIVEEMVQDYQNRTGKILYPGQPEMGLINTFAYRESKIRSQIQTAALNMLVDFAVAPFLDYLGALVGVIRISAKAAEAVMQFTFTSGNTGTIVPAGTRVQSQDGLATFELTDDLIITAGTTSATATVTCLNVGSVGNNYAIGQISVILDPWPFLQSVTNTAITSSGSDDETDDQLRARIKLAPNTFSVAGPKNAYKYFALAANPLIIDVGIDTSVPGTVEVYPLVAGGITTPTSIINDVEAALSDDKIRPLCDTVNVIAPTQLNYNLTVGLVLYADADPSTLSKVQAALLDYTQQQSMKLSRDVTTAKIINICTSFGGVYSVNLNGFAGQVVGANQYAYCQTLTVGIDSTSTENEF